MSLRKVVLVGAHSLSPTVSLLCFESEDHSPWSFAPGQWVNIRMPTDPPAARRAYSIAGSTAAGGLALAVTRVEAGHLSPRLHALAPGSTAWADGPHGFFTRADAHFQASALFVATGSGIAPIRPMLQAALEGDSPQVPLTLLFGCRTQADILFRAEFEAWASRHPRFHYEVTLSRPDSAWRGRSGYVQTHLADVLQARALEHAYICGLSGMVSAVRAALKPLGFGRDRVHSERFD